MISLEQVKLLEAKVTRAIDHVKKVTEENAFFKGKLDSYQKRIDELEVLIQQFKEDQSRIEDGILSALDRLNQFEDALEKTIAPENAADETSPKDEPPPKKDIPVKKEKELSASALIKESKEEPKPQTETLQSEALQTEEFESEEPKPSEELDIF